MGPILALTLILSAALPDRTLILEPKVDLRLVTGTEWDTNARRSVVTTQALNAGPAEVGEAIADGLLRVLVDAEAILKLTPLDRLSLTYVLGAKRFFREESEDLVAHDLSFNSAHRLSERFTLETQARFRSSRVRSGLRDYTIGSAGGGLSFAAHDKLLIAVYGRAEAFSFGASDDYSYLGPTAELMIRFFPMQRLELSLFGGPVLRAYDGFAYRVVTSNDGSTAAVRCDGSSAECPRTLRTDTEGDVGFRVSFRGSFIVGGEGILRIQRSTSEIERIDRYRLSAYATIPLPWELTLSLIGALQYNHGTSASQQLYVAEDDENQNSIAVQLGRKLMDPLRLDVRYALFANEFATAPARFLRQTVYLGLSCAFDAETSSE
ncbi:MAG: hypothetical protein U1E65_18310 [Myxococcota bacterium]